LPGSPDVVFPRERLAIFVHGCFWHRHPNCRRTTMPKTNAAYWHQKFAANVERDGRKIAELRRMGWKTLVVWECEIEADPDSTANRVEAALSDGK